MSKIINEPSLNAELRSTSRITDIETDEVRELVLYIDEPSFRFTVGQSIGINVPGKDEFGSENHQRRYSIAQGKVLDNGVELTIIVRRCFYIDDFNGEQYPGRASNYLCDAKVGDTIVVTGPYKGAFKVPEDKTANILMIGTGTGIAPFRAFIEQIYKEKGDWEGQVRLFYGAKSGLDLLYMNEQNNDLTNYYQESTFQAFNALTQRALSTEETAVEQSLKDNIEDAWELVKQPNTYIFVSGLEKVLPSLEMVFTHAAGSDEAWKEIKQKIKDEDRWSQLVYG